MHASVSIGAIGLDVNSMDEQEEPRDDAYGKHAVDSVDLTNTSSPQSPWTRGRGRFGWQPSAFTRHTTRVCISSVWAARYSFVAASPLLAMSFDRPREPHWARACLLGIHMGPSTPHLQRARRTLQVTTDAKPARPELGFAADPGRQLGVGGSVGVRSLFGVLLHLRRLCVCLCVMCKSLWLWVPNLARATAYVSCFCLSSDGCAPLLYILRMWSCCDVALSLLCRGLWRR